jgi:uncharacterized membrane protein YfcA
MATGLGLMTGGVLGAFFGARLAARAGDIALPAAFAVVLAAAGLELCVGAAGLGQSSNSPLLSAGLRASTAAVVIRLRSDSSSALGLRRWDWAVAAWPSRC